jgi:hypothetical protein
MGFAGILDLPTEILGNIFECLPNEPLYYLALMSRRLHFIVFPIYFSRNSVAVDAKYAEFTLRVDRWDVLSALQICPFRRWSTSDAPFPMLAPRLPSLLSSTMLKGWKPSSFALPPLKI